MKVADVDALVQPLLAAHSDLALVGRLMVIKPVRHIVRGIYIDRCSDSRRFKPKWAARFLFDPWDSITLNWAGDIPPPEIGLWRLGMPGLKEIFQETVEKTALPLLRPIVTIDDFHNFASPQRFPVTTLANHPLRHVVFAAGRGDFAAADAALARLMVVPNAWSTPAFAEEYDRVTRVLRPLIAARDRLGIGKLLREWEAWSVRKMKLESIWEPTPFPVETAE
jgi:hypothetical protein